MNAQRSGLRMIVGAMLIIFAVSVLGYCGARSWFPQPVEAPIVRASEVPPRPAAVTERVEAVVVSVQGSVEKGAADGRWTQVAPGDRLLADDSLRTDRTGRAELAIGDKSRLTVTENTQLKVRELTQAVHKVQLTRGRLVARYDADGERVLRIEDEKGSAVAETRAAKFSILSNGQTLAVATETGTVNLEAAGKTVQVGAGQRAFANVGQAPSAATPIPAAILLKLARAQPASAGLCAVIEGNVDPGSELEVDGQPVRVDAEGRFRAEVGRRSGQTSVRVAVRDASGRPLEQTVACAGEGKKPAVKLKMNWTKTDAG